MENKSKRRTARLAIVLGATVAGTAVIGWGGLAAWQAYTENNGNTVTAGTVSHTNKVDAGTPCNSKPSLPNACDVIFNVSGITPTWAGVTHTVVITNTGSLTSTFALSTNTAGTTTVHAPTGNLCGDLNLSVTDANGNSIFNGAMTGSINGVALVNSANSGAWATNDSDTFTFAITAGTGLATNSADAGQSCTASFLFTQSA